MKGYDMNAHRRMVRERLVSHVNVGGPGWHGYALDQAQKYEKEDPSLHAGLTAEVRRAIKAYQPQETSNGI